MARAELMDYQAAVSQFEVVIGMEVHVELNTATKMFCGCKNSFGDEPNTNVCPTCLGLPGALPAVNRRAVESSIAIGLALGCEIAPYGRFARKNYFYPDLAKNFQTSQYDEPIAFGGRVQVDLSGERSFEILIERAHMEEDAGKLTHFGGSTGRIQGAEYSLVDFNRAGVPLVEIVTKPVFGAGASAPELAAAYLRTIRDLVRELGVSDARMERGNVRCDANVSLRLPGAEQLGTRTETKNVNSVRSVESAVRYEIQRQAAVLASGGSITQETRHWHEDRGYTSAGRPKSDADDYRYFPEPDLVPIRPSNELIESIRLALPESPQLRRARLQAEWQLSDLELRDLVNAGVLSAVEETVKAGCAPQAAKKWWLGEIARIANQRAVTAEELAITANQVAAIQGLVEQGVLNDRLARDVLAAVIDGEGEPAQIIENRNLRVVSDDSALISAVDEALADSPDIVAKLKDGKDAAAGAVIGLVMRKFAGQADAAKVREIVLARAQTWGE